MNNEYNKKPETAYIYKMSWRHRGGRGRLSNGVVSDMYFIQAHHTLWGFDDPDCLIYLIKVSDDSPEYLEARQNSDNVE